MVVDIVCDECRDLGELCPRCKSRRSHCEPSLADLAANWDVDKTKDDMVNHPPHYTHGGIEVIAAIEAWGLGYHLGNVVKYVARAEHKGRYVEDLRKAKWYLEREISQSERNEVSDGR